MLTSNENTWLAKVVEPNNANTTKAIAAVGANARIKAVAVA